MSDKYTRPNRDNVDLGDFLVVACGQTILAEITGINENNIVARAESKISFFYPYEKSVVLKRDGTCLVGEKVTRYSEQGIENE